jgi:hypothetical protein
MIKAFHFIGPRSSSILFTHAIALCCVDSPGCDQKSILLVSGATVGSSRLAGLFATIDVHLSKASSMTCNAVSAIRPDGYGRPAPFENHGALGSFSTSPYPLPPSPDPNIRKFASAGPPLIQLWASSGKTLPDNSTSTHIVNK